MRWFVVWLIITMLFAFVILSSSQEEGEVTSMQPRIVEIAGTPKVNGAEITEDDLPYLLGNGDEIECRVIWQERSVIRVSGNGYWVINAGETGVISMIDSYYYYERR